MSKFILEIEEDYDFSLIGISCHSKDYRICREINKVLGIDLIRTDDYIIDEKKFSFYEFCEQDAYLDYFLITNRGENGFLIPEQKKVDYFLLTKGSITEELEKEFIWKINAISLVLTSFKIDASQLKSKENLLF